MNNQRNYFIIFLIQIIFIVSFIEIILLYFNANYFILFLKHIIFIIFVISQQCNTYFMYKCNKNIFYIYDKLAYF